ncbi:uncharacterized protein LOC144075308 [Stigmatopora argus]
MQMQADAAGWQILTDLSSWDRCTSPPPSSCQVEDCVATVPLPTEEYVCGTRTSFHSVVSLPPKAGGAPRVRLRDANRLPLGGRRILYCVRQGAHPHTHLTSTGQVFSVSLPPKAGEAPRVRLRDANQLPLGGRRILYCVRQGAHPHTH